MREDYKAGWELDNDWTRFAGSKNSNSKVGAGTVVSRRPGALPDDDEVDETKLDEALEGIPFACVICKEGYKRPVVTLCGHYFCEGCALGRYKKSPACAVCGQGTGGVFNGAKGLVRLLEKKKERVRRRKELAREKGEEVSEEEEGI